MLVFSSVLLAVLLEGMPGNLGGCFMIETSKFSCIFLSSSTVPTKEARELKWPQILVTRSTAIDPQLYRDLVFF